MMLLGLTGGVGMGKSTAADLLRQFGLPVIDTDIIAREVVEPGCPALAEIQRAFGPEMIGADGRLQREALARRVFADPDARKTLEGILHPRIRDSWLKTVEDWSGSGREVGVVVIPLLFETDAAGQFDATICVACSLVTQQKRLAPRGWSEQQIAQRIQAQWPIEKKMTSATFIVWTEGSLNIHSEQLRRILRSLTIDVWKHSGRRPAPS